MATVTIPSSTREPHPCLRMHRPVAALCAVLLVPALAACGGIGGPERQPSSRPRSPLVRCETTGELAEVSFSGEVGESITAEWSTEVEAPEEDDRDHPGQGRRRRGRGRRHREHLPVGRQRHHPGAGLQRLRQRRARGDPERPDQPGEVFSALFEGQTYGSRVAVVASASEVFGESPRKPAGCRSGRQPGDRRRPGGEAGGRADADGRHGAGRSPDDAADGRRGGRQARPGLDFSGIDEPASTPRSSASSWTRARARP